MGLHKKGVSIIIPVYNEEKIITENVNKAVFFLDGLEIPYKLFICDNGSTDSTRDKGEKIEKKFPDKIKFFSFKKRGVGLCFKKSLENSPYNFLITLDMDFSIDFKFVKKALVFLGNYDMVIASKKSGNEKRFFVRKVLSKIYIFLTSILFNLTYKDFSPSGKAYRKKSVLKATEINKLDDGSFYTTQILFFMKKNKMKIKEIPVDCIDYRVSKFNVYFEIIYRLKCLLDMFFKFRIFKYNQ